MKHGGAEEQVIDCGEELDPTRLLEPRSVVAAKAHDASQDRGMLVDLGDLVDAELVAAAGILRTVIGA